MLEDALWFSARCRSSGFFFHPFLAATALIAVQTTTATPEIELSSANSLLINGKSSETWTESKRPATGATMRDIPGGRSGDRRTL
jgi:hypothetical protein